MLITGVFRYLPVWCESFIHVIKVKSNKFIPLYFKLFLQIYQLKLGKSRFLNICSNFSSAMLDPSVPILGKNFLKMACSNFAPISKFIIIFNKILLSSLNFYKPFQAYFLELAEHCKAQVGNQLLKMLYKSYINFKQLLKITQSSCK